MQNKTSEIIALAPIFTQRIDSQSEVRRAGSEGLAAVPGTMATISHIRDPYTAMPLLGHLTMNELHGYELLRRTTDARVNVVSTCNEDEQSA